MSQLVGVSLLILKSNEMLVQYFSVSIFSKFFSTLLDS